MRAYVITAGALFALLVLAHVARLFAEGLAVAREPLFAGATLLSLGMVVWAWRVLRRPIGGERDQA